MPPRAAIAHGDARALPLPAESVDAVVTDPPYALRELPARIVADALTRWLAGDRDYIPAGQGFMGKSWDEFVPPPAAWDEAMRVLKPGGHVVAFSAPRTVDLLTMSMRLAALEIRDSLHWMYGSGFPKSLDVSKAIDKTASAEREVIGIRRRPDGGARDASKGGGSGSALTGGVDGSLNTNGAMAPLTAPATPEAATWSGWGTALKPGHEPIVLARKPLAGTVAANVLAYGTGALNVDGCRVGAPEDKRAAGTKTYAPGRLAGETSGHGTIQPAPHDGLGRWPANVALSHSCLYDPATGEIVGDACEDGCVPGCPVAELDAQSGDRAPSLRTARQNYATPRGTYSDGLDMAEGHTFGFTDSGGAARFYPCFRYEPKASASERPTVGGYAHSTVKPVSLMAWLIRLITPPGGLVLDMFAGSGPTGEAAQREQVRCLLLDNDPANIPLMRRRLDQAQVRDLRPVKPPVRPASGQTDLFGDLTG